MYDHFFRYAHRVFEPTWLMDPHTSLELFREVGSETSQGLILTDRHGLILQMNEAAEHLSGYLSAELEGSPLQTLIAEALPTDFLTKKRTPHTCTLQPQAGPEIPVALKFSPMIGAGQFQVLLLRDLRMELPDEARIKRQQTKLNALLEAIPDSIFFQDFDGNFLDYYPPVTGRFLAPGTQVKGRNIAQVFPEELATRFLEAFREIRAKRETVQFEFSQGTRPVSHFEARVVPMNNHKILSIVREVTESVRNKQELEKEKTLLRNYLDTAASMFVVINADHRILMANKKTCEVLGYSHRELLEKNWFSRFVPEEDRSRQEALFDRSIRRRSRQSEYFESYVITRKGIRRLIRWRNALLRDERGKVTGLICSGVDVTKRKEAEQELFESEARNRAILDAIPDLILIHDCQGRLLDLETSEAQQDLFPQGGLKQRQTEALFPSEVARQMRDIIEKVCLSGEPQTLEFTMASPRGLLHFEARYVHMEGQRALAVARDITRSKSVQNVLELRNRALEAASDGIVISDARLPDQPVIYSNRAFTKITGYEAAEILGRNCRLLQGKDRDQESIALISQAVSQGEPCRAVLRNYRKNGELFWNELSITPIKDTVGITTHFIGVLRDVSQKIAEENRQQGIRNLLEAITEDRPLPEIGKQLCELLVAQTGSGSALIATLHEETRQLQALANYALPASLVGPVESIPIDRQPPCPCSKAANIKSEVIVEDIMADKQWKDWDSPMRENGFMACWSFPVLSSSNQVLGTCTLYRPETGGPDRETRELIREVTQLTGVAVERHQSQVKLRQSNAQLEAYTQILEQSVEERTREVKATMQKLLKTNEELEEQINTTRQAESRALASQALFAAIARHFPKGVIMVLDRHLAFVHLEGEDMPRMGLDTWNYQGQRLQDLPGFEPAQIDLLKARIGETLAGSHLSFEMEYLEQAYMVNSTPLSIDDQLHWALLVWSNTTEMKHTEQELIRALETEQELNDLKSRFMSMASHEFRTPLSAILSSAILIGKQNEPGRESKRERYVKQIKNNVRNLVVILDDFLSLSKLEEGEISCQPADFDLRELLRSVLEEMETNLKVGQHFVEDCQPTSYKLWQDPKLTRHILVNLLSNAIKYSAENSTIEIVLGREGRHFVLSVRDEGMGIPENEQGQIFNRFFRARNAENIQGTGLGLNIVKQYTELMGGTIEFSSKLGEGSLFILKLPSSFNTRSDEKDPDY